MTLYLLRPFQHRPTGRTGYAIHEITAGSERLGWTTSPDACGAVVPVCDHPGYVLEFGSEAGIAIGQVADACSVMRRRGHEFRVAI